MLSRLMLLALGLALQCSLMSGGAATGTPLKVMSYNLRFAAETGPNAWPDRKPLMVELLKKVDPDIIGTQEGVYLQLRDIEKEVGLYDWIGLGREGGSKGEFMAVFYRKKRFEPLAFDHFWLSDTPELMASSTWGNKHKRMVTWVLLKDVKSGSKLYVVNTHFDHLVQEAREQSARLLREKVQVLDAAIPVVVTGDFNCVSNNTAYKTLTADGFLRDSWFDAKSRRGEGLGTFNGFQQVQKNDARIDWILYRGALEIESTEIVTWSKDGLFPSDHFPVLVKAVFR